MIEKLETFNNVDFHFPDFFRMPKFENHIFMDHFWKIHLKITYKTIEKQELAKNDQMEHFMNMNHEFEIS